MGHIPDANAAKVIVREMVSEKGAKERTTSFSVRTWSFGRSFSWLAIAAMTF
jgi:hypothetical protein